MLVISAFYIIPEISSKWVNLAIFIWLMLMVSLAFYALFVAFFAPFIGKILDSQRISFYYLMRKEYGKDVAKDLVEIYDDYPDKAPTVMTVYEETRSIPETQAVMKMCKQMPRIFFGEFVFSLRIGILREDWETWTEEDFVNWRDDQFRKHKRRIG